MIMLMDLNVARGFEEGDVVVSEHLCSNSMKKLGIFITKFGPPDVCSYSLVFPLSFKKIVCVVNQGLPKISLNIGQISLIFHPIKEFDIETTVLYCFI